MSPAFQVDANALHFFEDKEGTFMTQYISGNAHALHSLAFVNAVKSVCPSGAQRLQASPATAPLQRAIQHTQNWVQTFLCFITTVLLAGILSACGGGSGSNADSSTSGTQVAATSVTLDKTAATLVFGGSTQLNPIIAPANASNTRLTWTSSDSNVATVDATGKVTAVAMGTATITATTADGSLAASTTVTVQATPVAVTGMTLDNLRTTIIVSFTTRLTPTITPANATNTNLTWTSSNAAVATVSASGVVKAVAVGQTTITATTEDGGFTATSNVKVMAINGTASSPLSLQGNQSVFAGSGAGYEVDGTGQAADFASPTGITTDGTNLYVADVDGNTIRKVVIATGEVTTLAGSGTAAEADGTGTGASFKGPYGITTDGTNLYVADADGYTIRQIVIATGVVTTLAGSRTAAEVDGTGTAASFNLPLGITTDGTNLYVTDFNGNTIRQIVIATGMVTTLAGSGTAAEANGTGLAASFKQPAGITTDGTNLYVTDAGGTTIRQVVIATGVVTTLAGSGSYVEADGIGTAASFNHADGITTDGSNLYVVDLGGTQIRKIAIATNTVTSFSSAPSGGWSVTTDGKSLYVASGNQILKIQ